MEPLQLLLLIILSISIALLIYFIWWTRKLPKPKPGKGCDNTEWAWDSSCLFFQEKEYDSSLSSPNEISPYIIGFSAVGGAGNPLFLPMWYRFRYVNVNTGGYSSFSKWTASPVISGSCCLPCPGGIGVCDLTLGSGSCTYNQPIIGISQKDSAYNPFVPDSDGSFVYINVHRYVGKTYDDTTPPDDNTEDEIVGYMTTGFTYGGELYYGLTDILYNPCDPPCAYPSWCTTSGSGTCAANACST